MAKTNIYWGFLDHYGQITVVKFKSYEQIDITERMPFVVGIFDPFHAIDKVDAYRKCKEKLKEGMN